MTTLKQWNVSVEGIIYIKNALFSLCGWYIIQHTKKRSFSSHSHAYMKKILFLDGCYMNFDPLVTCIKLSFSIKHKKSYTRKGNFYFIFQRETFIFSYIVMGSINSFHINLKKAVPIKYLYIVTYIVYTLTHKLLWSGVWMKPCNIHIIP